MKKYALALASIVLLVNFAYPQGQYIKKGQNGAWFGGSFASNSSASMFGGQAGFSLNGIFDVAIGYAGVKYDPSDLGDLKAGAWTPEIAIHAIKQNSSSAPVSISFYAGYEFDTFSSDVLDYYAVEMKGSSLSLGGAIYRDVKLSGNTLLQPFASFTYLSAKITLKDDLGNSEETKDNTTVFSLGSGLSFAVGDTTSLIITPRVAFQKDLTTFAISVNLLWAIKK